MGEIVAASEQQTLGIKQVVTAVEQMNKVTQQTAANAEESSSASEEMSSQADEMKTLVSAYSLSDAGGHRSGRRWSAPAEVKAVASPVETDGNGDSPANRAAELIPFEEDNEAVLSEF